MGLDKATILAQIDDLLEAFDHAKQTTEYDDFSGGMPAEHLQATATRLLAGITRLSSPDSQYSRMALAIEGHEGYVVQKLGGILQALRADVAAGYTQSLVELVHADVFADFLAMARRVAAQGLQGRGGSHCGKHP